jgi:hypothetical protein
MPESSDLRDHLLAQEVSRPEEGLFHRFREIVKLIGARSVFWVYERGSWQYDIILAVILAFIFLTPRSVFNDRPTLELSDLRHFQGVIEAGRAKDGWHYLVDSRLVESRGTQKPEDAVREILQRRLHKPFTIKSLEPTRDRNNVVLGYSVVVAQ